MGLWGTLISNWKLVALAAVAFAFGLLRIRLTILDAALEKAKAERDEMSSYRETRKVIDHATDQHLGDDPAAARRFLHERGQSDHP